MAAVFQLVKRSLSPKPGEKVLKAADFATFEEARTLVAKLNEEERAMRARHAAFMEVMQHKREEEERALQTRAEEIFHRRHEEGYQEGVAEGKREYARKIMETVISSVEYLENLEVSLVRIVGDVTRRMLGELDHDDLIVRLVRQALQSVRGERRVTIRVASRDEAAVRKGLAGLLQHHATGAAGFLNILPDPDLPQGSCILESEMGVVEASLETQLKNLETALLSRVKQD